MDTRPPKAAEGRPFADDLITSAREHLEKSFYALGERRFGEFALSAGIAVEHLSKAMLCEIHPALIAEKDLHSLLAMVGLSAFSPDKGNRVRTIGAREALERCSALFPELGEIVRSLRELLERRNAVAHLGSTPTHADDTTLYAYLRFIVVCCEIMSLAKDDLTPVFADALDGSYGAADINAFPILCRVAAQRERFKTIARDYPEVLVRRAPEEPIEVGAIPCPACDARMAVIATAVSEIRENDDQYAVRVATLSGITCWRCGLNLDGENELGALAIAREYAARERLGRLLVCADCNLEFTFTVRDEKFFHERGMSQPRRCRVCAKARRQSIRRDFTVACANCGRSTTVPFVPRLDEVTGAPIKPVLCRECFDSRNANA